MQTVCKETSCSGCQLCVDVCPADAVSLITGIGAYYAQIDENKCINCGKCRKFCPQNHPPKLNKPLEWHQGWSRNTEIRAYSSSGGIATELAYSFVKNQGEVLTCRFKNGRFGFEFFNDLNDLASASGSKYVKSDPSGIYQPLLEKLKRGKRVLMIALPCQIAAAKVYTEDHANLYTVDLICHGTPSPEILKAYLKGRNIDISKMTDIRFRKKTDFELSDGYKIIDRFGTDAYTSAFLNALTYTENCYECPFARLERVADMTLGDSWGSELDLEEQKKGISLILCQTAKGRELLGMSDVELKKVNLEKAVKANKQLNAPSPKHRKREYLIRNLEKGKEFEKMVFRIDSKRIIKNLIKTVIGKRHTGGGYGLIIR